MPQSAYPAATRRVPPSSSPWPLTAIVAIAAVAPGVLMVAPAVAIQLAAQWQLSSAQTGYLFSCELGAMSCATLPAWWWISRCSWRRVAWTAALIFLCGNLLSAATGSFYWLLPCRFMSALAGGTLMILCMNAAAGTAVPARAFSLWVLGQLLLGAIGLMVLPSLFAHFGLMAAYVLLALLILCCLPLLNQLPAGLPSRVSTAPVRALPGQTLLALLAVLLFYTGQSATWTFSGTLATLAGLNSIESGQCLAVATLFGMIGAVVAGLLSAQSHKAVLLLSGYGLLIASIVLFSSSPRAIRFSLAAILFEFSWTAVLPFILFHIARLDTGGKLMSSVNLVTGAGLAAGPTLAGQLLARSETPAAMLAAAVIAECLSAGLLLLCVWRQARTTRRPTT